MSKKGKTYRNWIPVRKEDHFVVAVYDSGIVFGFKLYFL